MSVTEFEFEVGGTDYWLTGTWALKGGRPATLVDPPEDDTFEYQLTMAENVDEASRLDDGSFPDVSLEELKLIEAALESEIEEVKDLCLNNY